MGVCGPREELLIIMWIHDRLLRRERDTLRTLRCDNRWI